MNISSINTVTPHFTGEYLLNANQTMPNGEACLERDLMLGVWLQEAKNQNDIYTKITDFFKGEYNEDNTAPCVVKYNIPDSRDSKFEDCMNKCGQKFEKIA